MSVMFEVWYKRPDNPLKETALTNRVSSFGGRFDYREEATEHTGVCLTYEFDSWDTAAQAAEVLPQLGEHVEGPADY